MKWKTACATALLLANGNPDTGRAASAAASAPTAAPTAAAVCASLPSTDAMLPCGMFHTAGSQVVDGQNRAVRLSCMAVELDPTWGAIPMRVQFLTLVLMGRNCIRTSINNDILQQNWNFIDQVVAAAKAVSIRVIIDHHLDEGGCPGGQQGNGLWFDSGPGTDGTDGCGDRGNVTAQKFQDDWVATAKRYAGNDTVIGYDLDNEPVEGRSVWGGGGPTDIHAMYQTVGNAILAVDSTKLIITEGPISYPDQPEGDLTHVATMPVVLAVPNRVVYSVHEYPKETAGIDSCGAPFIQRMNADWGYLITRNIAPVWIGEMATQFNAPNTADDQCWATTLSSYVNGTAPGGIVIPPGGQGVGTDWWWWYVGRPFGLLTDNSMTKAYGDQATLISGMGQAPIAGAVSTSSDASTPTAYGQVLGAISATVAPTSAADASGGADQTSTQASSPGSSSAPAAVAPVGGSPYGLPAPTVATPDAPAVTLVTTPPSLSSGDAASVASVPPAAPTASNPSAVETTPGPSSGTLTRAAVPAATAATTSTTEPPAAAPSTSTATTAPAAVTATTEAGIEAALEAEVEALPPRERADVLRTVRRYGHQARKPATGSTF